MEIFTDKHSHLKFYIKSDIAMYDHFAKNGINEYSLIKWSEQFIDKNSTFVDIGAHIGTYSMILSKSCKQVISFEPQKITYQCLVAGIAENNIFNIKTYNCALGDKEDIMDLNIVSEDGGGSSLLKEFPNTASVLATEHVQVKTLDSFNLTNVDFIKIDAEGFELEIIKGGLHTLENNNYPYILFEAWPDDWYKEKREEMIAFLKELGYKIHKLRGNDNMYLAADHERRLLIEENDKTNAETNAEKLAAEQAEAEQIQKLTAIYDAGKLLEITDWHEAYTLARHYRIKSSHMKSYQCAKWGLKLITDKNNKNYSNESLQKIYLLHEELSIVTCYIRKHDEGLYYAELVILSPYAPFNTINLAASNERFYINKFPTKNNTSAKTIKYHELKNNFISSSSSLIQHNNKYILNLRSVNYRINKQGEYDILDLKSVVKTTNYLLTLDTNLNIFDSTEIIDFSTGERYSNNITGMEDMRLIPGNNFEGFCVSVDMRPDFCPRVCYFAGEFANGVISTLKELIIDGFPVQCEKNWLPFYIENSLHFIYSFQPFRLYSLDKETFQCKLVHEKVLTEQNIGGFRGSTPPIPFENGWLMLIHDIHYAKPRFYRHRFVWLNKEFTSIKFSTPYYFEQIGIEYSLSICPSYTENDYYITYSVNDASTKIITITKEQIVTILNM
jgi:FkbM family methyltransferase